MPDAEHVSPELGQSESYKQLTQAPEVVLQNCEHWILFTHDPVQAKLAVAT